MKTNKNQSEELKKKVLKKISDEIPSLNIKTYAHFDRPFSVGRYIIKNTTGTNTKYLLTEESSKKIEQKIKKIKNYITNPNNIAKHAFYPFIAFDIEERRVSIKNRIKYYEKLLPTLTGEETNKCKETLKKLKEKGIIKKRPIRYSSHMDGYIYSYYAKILSELYEQKVNGLNLNKEILAYRKLPSVYIKNEEIKPNNCTMAREIFEEIKKRNCDCYVLAFDISSFYDFIDHQKLYEEWSKILDVKKLPSDHLTVFNSLTKYVYVDLKEICYYFNSPKKEICKNCCAQCTKKIIKKIPRILFRNAYEFRDFRKWYKSTFKDTDHKNFHKNPGTNYENNKCKPYGIPQGSAMSALLSNIYMLPFDAKMKTLADSVSGLYRRYCDDIIFICPHNDDIKKQIVSEIKICIKERGEFLKIHPIEEWDKHSKSQCYDFTDKNKIKEQPLQYLGFYFDGNQVRIREGSLANYLRKSVRAITAMKFSAIKKIKNMHKKNIPIQEKQKKLYRHHLYEQYTYRGKRNFISYAYRAFNVFDDSVIKNRIRNHTKRLIGLIKQADAKIIQTIKEL